MGQIVYLSYPVDQVKFIHLVASGLSTCLVLFVQSRDKIILVRQDQWVMIMVNHTDNMSQKQT
jgi:hypothetical protein